jgi:tetratricopeptide (TPR) repeat protein
MADIDRLTASDRTILRYASVLGMSFDADLVRALFEGEDELDGLTWDRLVQFIDNEGGGHYRFRHALMRDAAYEGLPYRRRKQLHQRVGNAILGASGTDHGEHAELLSMHFFLAGDDDQAFQYSEIAAKRAEAAYANIEASRFYERAIDAGRRLPGVGDLELVELYDELSEVLRLSGHLQQAAGANASARRLAKQDPLTLARLLQRRSILEDALGRNPQALRWATRARKILEGIPGTESARQLAQLMSWYAEALQFGGRSREAIVWSERAIEQAMAVGDREALWLAYDTLDWAKFTIGESTGGRNLRLALEIADETGNLRARARVLDGLGFLGYYEGRWTEALGFYEQARATYAATGDPVNPPLMVMNVAEIYCERGNLDEAEVMLRDSLRVWQASGHPYFVAQCLSILARVMVRAQRFDEALTMSDNVLAMFTDVAAPQEFAEAAARAAECRVLMGDAERALELTDQAQARIGGAGAGGQSTPLIYRTRGYALAQWGRWEEAHAALEESLDAARARRQDLDVALALHALIRLGEAGDPTPPPTGAAREREAILQRLGVELVMEVPLTPVPA